MITLILSIAVFCFLIDANLDWENERTVRGVAKGLGFVIAFGVLLMAFFSLFETHPAATSWAFRTGELVPVAMEMDQGGYEILVNYHQKSWWKWKIDGKWPARADSLGEWEFWDDNKWRAVPLEVYDSSGDGRNIEFDHRGVYEQ